MTDVATTTEKPVNMYEPGVGSGNFKQTAFSEEMPPEADELLTSIGWLTLKNGVLHYRGQPNMRISMGNVDHLWWMKPV